MTRPAVSLRRLARWAGLAALAASLLLTGGAPRPAHAAGMVVNTLADANPPLTDGLCSLREAITNANDNAVTWPDCPAGAGADTITFSVSGTIVLVAGLPDITDSAGLVIDGSGTSVTVDGGLIWRHFKITSAAAMTLRGMRIINGADGSGAGGALLNAGAARIEESELSNNNRAILNTGNLDIRGSALTSNSSSWFGDPGAISNSGTATIVDSLLAWNTSGAILNVGSITLLRTVLHQNISSEGSGGALANGGTADIQDSIITGNSARHGGGVSSGGPLTLRRTQVVGNVAALDGGGVLVVKSTTTIVESTVQNNVVSNGSGGGVSSIGNLTILNSNISHNLALGAPFSGNGGGIYSAGGLSLINSTVSANTAELDGGGIYQFLMGVTITNSTIVQNRAGGVGGAFRTWSFSVGPVQNSLIDGNAAAGGGHSCSGTLTLTGPNLIGDTTGCSITGTPPIVADPLLAPLADNGGPTWTHALLPGSPALGVGDPAVCAAAPVNGLDQRGVARPQGTGCDLGAYEATPVGGKHLRVGAPPGEIKLGWDSGFSQTGYTLLTYNTATASATLTNLPANGVAHTDSAVANGTVYCYVLAATGASGVLGLSDLACGLTGLEAGTVLPVGFTLSLHGTTDASLSWQAPTGEADSYLLVRIPLDGSAASNLPLAGSATSSVQPVPAAGACFQLVAYKGAASGLTNVVCGVPGVSTLSSVSAEAALQAVAERVADSPSLRAMR